MTAWQLKKVHPLLKQFHEELFPSKELTNVLFPLCGASVDLGYLSRRGYPCLGVEGVGKAIDALFKDYGPEVAPKTEEQAAKFTRPWLRVAEPGWWQRHGIPKDGSALGEPGFLLAIQGDFCDLGDAPERFGLPPFGACFDRGGLVAVNPADRKKYAEQLTSLMAPGGRVLLVAVEHDAFSNGTLGPPFELTAAHVNDLFGQDFEVRELSREDKFKEEPVWKERGCTRFDEVAYLLVKKGAKLTLPLSKLS